MPQTQTATNAKIVHCVGAADFTPGEYFDDTETQKQVDSYLERNDFLHAITIAFKLPERDTYVYHAIASVRLAEVQHIISLGAVNGLHGWYRAPDGSIVSQSLSVVADVWS
jgi:hypothetical protein